MKSKNEANQNCISELENRLNYQDRYCRRWNLRLEGLTECVEDNVKTRVMDICKEVVAEEDRNFVTSNVDIAHRVGRSIADSGKGKKPRPVIIRFTSRTVRDLTWKGAKGNDFLKKNKIRPKGTSKKTSRSKTGLRGISFGHRSIKHGKKAKEFSLLESRQ